MIELPEALTLAKQLENEVVGKTVARENPPASHVPDLSRLTVEQLDSEMEKGYADVAAGRTKAAGAAFEEIRKDYGV